MGNDISDTAFLTWIAERLEHVHGEDHNVDFLHRLRKIITNYPTPAPLAPEVAEAAKHCGQLLREAEALEERPTVEARHMQTILRAVRATAPVRLPEPLDSIAGRILNTPRIPCEPPVPEWYISLHNDATDLAEEALRYFVELERAISERAPICRGCKVFAAAERKAKDTKIEALERDHGEAVALLNRIMDAARGKCWTCEHEGRLRGVTDRCPGCDAKTSCKWSPFWLGTNG